MPESNKSYARKTLENIYGAGEVTAMLGTGFGTEVVGGLAGLASLPFVGPEKAGKIVETVQSKTYQPKGASATKWLESAAPHIKGITDYWTNEAIEFEQNTGIPREITKALPIVSAELAGGGIALKGARRVAKYKPYKETKEYTQREKGGPKEYKSKQEQRLGKKYDYSEHHELTRLHAMVTSGNTGNKSWYTKWDPKRYEELKAKYGVDDIPYVREIFETDDWPLFLLGSGKVTNNLIRNPNYGKKDGGWGSKDREYPGDMEFDSFQEMKDHYEKFFDKAWNTLARNIRHGDVKQDIKTQGQKNLENFLKDDEVPSADIPMFTDLDTGRRISLREMQEMNKRGEIKEGPWKDSLGIKDKQRLGKGAHTDELWKKRFQYDRQDLEFWDKQSYNPYQIGGSKFRIKVGNLISEKVNLDNHPNISRSYIKNKSKFSALMKQIQKFEFGDEHQNINLRILQNNAKKVYAKIWDQEMDIIARETASGRLNIKDMLQIFKTPV